MLDAKDARASIEHGLVYLQFLVVVIATIALTMSFYLLLVSTTSNVQENVWEYGCLRALGLTTK